MSLFSDLMTGGLGSVVKEVGGVVSELVTTDKERLDAANEMEALGIKREEIYLQDTQSARHMQEEALKQDDLFSKRFIYWFSAGWSVFAALFMAAVTFLDIPEKNAHTVDVILGFLLGTAIAGIFNFFLGTTHRSQKKDDTINALTGAAQK